MRQIALILAGAGLTACSTAPQPVLRSADKQAEYTKLIDGKVAGPVANCLPAFNAGDMRVIDDNTIVFRQSANRVYVANLQGGCPYLGRGGYAMVTRQVGGSGLCRGDIAQVVDTGSGMSVGSCVFDGFTPYKTP
ncbi:MAG: hypothetical protein ABIS39_01880 [Sphingomicrobium sp.]